MVAIGRLLNGAARLIFDPKFSEVATKTLRSSKQAMGYSKFGRQVKDAFVAAESKTSASIWKNMGNSIKEFPSDITSAAKKPGLWNATKAVGGQVLKRLPLIFGVWAIGSELPTIYEAFKDKGLVGGVIETAKSAVNVLRKHNNKKGESCMNRNITDSIIYIGANDHDIDLFEGQYIVPNGMAYNSYAVVGEKIAIMDTIDQRKTGEWLQNIEAALKESKPDYLVVQHMEPDHSASIQAFVEKYPDATVVGNKKTFKMIGQFFPELEMKNVLEVENGDKLDLGGHELNFVFAPMVHWPEVMMTYDPAEKILFSADGFGKFGALDVDEDWACEARRYYFGIVGKYGAQVQTVLKKAAALEIEKILPLHGPMLEENLGYYIGLYDTWSSYLAESDGIFIAYTSVYGHTKAAAEMLRDELVALGVPTVEITDLARDDCGQTW